MQEKSWRETSGSFIFPLNRKECGTKAIQIGLEARKTGFTGQKNGTHRVKFSNQPEKIGTIGPFLPAINCFTANRVKF